MSMQHQPVSYKVIKFHKSPSLSSINLGINNFLKKFNDNDISFRAYSFHSIVEPLNGLLDGKGQTTNIGNISEFLEQNKNKKSDSLFIEDIFENFFRINKFLSD